MTISDHLLVSGNLRGRASQPRLATASWVPDMPLKVSPGIAQVIDGVRTRFGVSLEILGASLTAVVPENGGELYREMERSPETRTAVAAALEGGQVRALRVGEVVYVVQPLRGDRATRRAGALLVIACTRSAAGALVPSQEAATRLIDFLRSAIEADLAAAESLREERSHARRTRGTVRFLGQLGSTVSEEELANAVVHAAAVWFDVDARLYRRDIDGTLRLAAHLPGAPDANEGTPLKSLVDSDPAGTVRLTAADDLAGLEWAAPEALLVPIHVSGTADWVLAIGGALPLDGQLVFETLAQTMGAHLRRLEIAHGETVRDRFETVLRSQQGPPMRVVTAALQQIVTETSAASGSVTLFDSVGRRQIAAIGSPVLVEEAPADPTFTPGRVVYPMTLAPGTQAVLELTRADGAPFSHHALLALREAAPLFHVFLSGFLRADARAQGAEAHAAFVARIEEEVERAKRFNLGLSILLVDVNPFALNSDMIHQVVTGVRMELRTSDLLGIVGPGRIAALLVHTDGAGVSGAAGRIRHRLELLLEALGLPALRLGRAVLSRDCRTSSELLSRASRDQDAIVAAN